MGRADMIKTIGEKFIYNLADIYDAEQRFLEAQQTMLGYARSVLLHTMLQEHSMQTREQIANLEQIYARLGTEPIRVTCDPAIGLVAESQKAIEQTAENAELRDSAIVTALLKVEHYEIASYRDLLSVVRLLDKEGLNLLLSHNLEQEEHMVQRLEADGWPLLQHAVAVQRLASL